MRAATGQPLKQPLPGSAGLGHSTSLRPLATSCTGGTAKFTVGIDIENTSQEGLQDLLTLQDAGNAQTFIYHNEDDSTTFHPKVYLFKSDTLARLIIGSNNLTQAGLFTNTEAGLQIDAALTEPVIVEIERTLASWRENPDGFVKPLDDAVLKALVDRGYVLSEGALRRRRSGVKRAAKAREGGNLPRLFPAGRVCAPRPPGQPALASVAQQAPLGHVLLMRVRSPI